MNEYDSNTCITAGDLRQLGLGVPENIPDCAWTYRSSLRFEPGTPNCKGNRFVIPIRVYFLQPFRWIEVSVVVGKPEELGRR